MKYELYRSSDNCSTDFFPEDNLSAKASLEKDAVLVWTCFADSWEEAVEKMNEFLKERDEK